MAIERSGDSGSVFIVGAGAVAHSFAGALAQRHVEITGIWSRSRLPESGRLKKIGPLFHGDAPPPKVGECDLVLVCVADDALGRVGKRLQGILAPHTVVAHTSGCFPGTALCLAPGSSVGSIHPLVALPPPRGNPDRLMGASFALEGDEKAVEELDRLVAKLGGQTFRVKSKDKAKYHAAAVIASNLVVVLLADALDLWSNSTSVDARALLSSLAQGAVANVAANGIPDALTGPIARGDVDTIRAHLAAIPQPIQELYRAASRRAIRIARAGGLPEARASLLEEILAGSNAPPQGV